MNDLISLLFRAIKANQMLQIVQLMKYKDNYHLLINAFPTIHERSEQCKDNYYLSIGFVLNLNLI